ncbi:NmrA family NAD(P)-binding protein [Variovorax sp.]|jgi:NAD(P)H dehydrogenase (quinone)|uniref:NmrA family NAD(P)-binding protein n=1 Tax=Variovorax sp. TaxID=1871043 RepID=UPI0012008147|nr:NAD(P)H-binding protein [Variovorax sp.]TAJ65360.1 MAG: NAD-dependent epimerase/dehydratase family protein [Variovorax sp.]
MHAITGITGKVGGAAARALLASGHKVRAVVRDADKARPWAALGCEVAVAEMEDADALARAFADCTGVFVLPPPCFDPLPGFPEARAVIAAVRQALEAARPARVVCLSTVGAQATQPNLLSQRSLMEEGLSPLPLPLALLRPAWFLDNLAWDVAPARERGVLPGFLQPLERPVPMVSTLDVGRVAAELLQEDWQGRRVVELEGPARVTQHEIAATFARVLGRPVQAEAVPRQTWGALFREQGMRDPVPRIQMLDGFNEGWIAFEGDDASVRKGRVTLEDVVRQLVAG